MEHTEPAVISGTYTFAEAAARLGIGVAQAYRLDQAGDFPVSVVYLGKVKKVRVAELEAWLQGSAPTPAPGGPNEHVGAIADRLETDRGQTAQCVENVGTSASAAPASNSPTIRPVVDGPVELADRR